MPRRTNLPVSDNDHSYHDCLGNVVALIVCMSKASPADTSRQSRKAGFGKRTVYNATGQQIPDTAYANMHGYTGREHLPLHGLMDYRNRSYSTTLGRFLQTDPIRFDAGDVNLYRYVGNSVVNLTDPLGLLDFRWHGHYGGPGWTNGGRKKGKFPDRNPKPEDIGPPKGPEPKDDEDACYMEHDRCYARCKHDPCVKDNEKKFKECKSKCDADLVACLQKLLRTPTSIGAMELFGGITSHGNTDRSIAPNRGTKGL